MPNACESRWDSACSSFATSYAADSSSPSTATISFYKEISIQMHQIIRRFVPAALACLPIDELWGEGRRFSRRMYLEGVNTIAYFANMERVRVR